MKLGAKLKRKKVNSRKYQASLYMQKGEKYELKKKDAYQQYILIEKLFFKDLFRKSLVLRSDTNSVFHIVYIYDLLYFEVHQMQFLLN